MSLLGRVVVEENVRDIAASQLTSQLHEELFVLDEQLGLRTNLNRRRTHGRTPWTKRGR